MKKIRYGVIGIKGFGKHHIQAASINPHVEIVAFSDIDEEFLLAKSKASGVKGFSRYQDMLSAGILDAVSIVVPHHLHYSIGKDCLKAGLHIYLEKPFVNTISQADTLLGIAREKNLKICVGYQYRNYQVSRFLKKCLDEGKIGKVMRILWTWLDFRPEAYYRRDAWRCDFETSGGGVLMNQASHDIDLIQWMFGKPKEVCAFAGNHLHKAEIDDIACVNAIFETGAFGSFQFGINHPKALSIRQIAGTKGMIAMQDVQSLAAEEQDFIEVGLYEKELSLLSEEALAPHVHPVIQWKKHCVNPKTPFLRKLLSPKRMLMKLGFFHPKYQISPGISELMNSFISSILNNTQPFVSGENARNSVEFINAIFLSALKKKTVSLPLDPQEYESLYENIAKGKIQIPKFFR
ncbi:MAG: Gfo/Idh/MocA family oxidoreductase [Candidatus Brocadiae bacterium]|nr:Gfo/Idh/MocA family oxidoreductase [Candidatus Brocadiia bacterium]